MTVTTIDLKSGELMSKNRPTHIHKEDFLIMTAASLFFIIAAGMFSAISIYSVMRLGF